MVSVSPGMWSRGLALAAVAVVGITLLGSSADGQTTIPTCTGSSKPFHHQLRYTFSCTGTENLLNLSITPLQAKTKGISDFLGIRSFRGPSASNGDPGQVDLGCHLRKVNGGSVLDCRQSSTGGKPVLADRALVTGKLRLDEPPCKASLLLALTVPADSPGGIGIGFPLKRRGCP
jgi:hypothetical protein